MQPDASWDRIKQLFAAIAALPAEQRDAALREANASDAERREVLALLAAHPPTEAPSPEPDAPGSTVASEGPGTRIGPYRLLQQIGEGGFGTVYTAEQETPIRRRVALKIVKPGMDSQQVLARFEQERQALALMDHPNIARVFDGGSTPAGRPFFVMELVQGDPITTYCDQERLTAAERLRLFADVVRAVQHAHQKGVIHRDLKPSNVLVTVVDGKPIPKVIDFGIAKATQGRLTERTLFTEHKQMLGTPLYMSPEQAHLSGVDVDTRSDVYSLGVLLYELLTGTTPFRREELLAAGVVEMVRVLQEVEPPRPSTRVATLGATTGAIAAQRRVDARRLQGLLRGDLDWIVMKCLEKERGRRYATANELVLDVERHLAGEAVHAVPPSLGYRVRKFVRRYRLQTATLTIVFLSMAAALWQARAAAESNAHALETERRSSAREAFRQAHLHLAVGDWSAALQRLASTEVQNHDPVAAALAQVDAWEATGQRDLAEQTLAALCQRTDLGASRDLVQLLWFDPSRMRPEGAPALAWQAPMRTLEESPQLNVAWRGYARALGAESAQQAIEHLDAVLHADPKHRRAAEIRLWLVMFLYGPEAGLEASARFRLLWPQDDYGKFTEAMCLKLLGRDSEAGPLAASLQAEAADRLDRVLRWQLNLRNLIDDAREAFFAHKRSLGTNLKASLAAAAMVRDLRVIGSTLSALRCHPVLRRIGSVLESHIGKSGLLLTNPRVQRQVLDQVLRLADLPSVRVATAFLQCGSGAETEGLDALRVLTKGHGDLFMSKRMIIDWAVIQAGALAIRTSKEPPESQDASLKQALFALAPELVLGLSQRITQEVKFVMELTSIIGGKWRTIECVGHLMARPDADARTKLDAVASLLRVGAASQAEEILRPILAAQPDNPVARELERRLEDLRQKGATEK